MPTILMVSASPLDQDRLRLGAELRDIRHALQRSRKREEWKIESNEAITVDDLRRALLDFQPTILHFSGHGGGDIGLCFEDENGVSNLARAEPLARLLHHFKAQLKCVVLNACYSKTQADVIKNEIDYVIGMNSAVGDSSAAKFSVSFYDAIFAGVEFRAAFDLGCAAIDLNNMEDSNVPVFITGNRLHPVNLTYTSIVPEIESIVYAFCNTTFSERSSFVVSGEIIKPIMDYYYKSFMHSPVGKVTVLSMKQIGEHHWIAEIKGAEFKLVYVKIHNRSVFIEWEATVGLWSIPPNVVASIGIREPVVARAEAELIDYYNHEFREPQNKKAYQSIRVSHDITGYVRRGTKTYHDLMEILLDGNRHRVTLKMSAGSTENNLLIIEEVLSPTWLYKENAASTLKCNT